MNDDWDFPAPKEDPEARGSKLGKDRAATLVPDGDFVEGQIEEDGRKDGPSCPFPH
jgi:hypothetical protein